MRILIIDPLSLVGHINYNLGIIRQVSEDNDYSIICSKYMAESLVNRGIEKDSIKYTYSDEIELPKLRAKYRGKILAHIINKLLLIKLYLVCLRISRDYDKVIFTSIDIYSFCMISYLYGVKSIVIDHGIGNVISKPLYRLAWKITSHNSTLIVFEDYIKEMVHSIDLARNIKVLRHPLPKRINERCDTQRSDAITAFAPSASNDTKFLETLKELVPEDGVRIIAKGTEEYDNGMLCIYKHRLSDEEFDSLFVESDIILIPYEENYNYRTSGVVFEGIVNSKYILIRSNNTLRYYRDVFPSIITFENSSELLRSIKSIDRTRRPDYDYSEYADEELRECMRRILSEK